MEKKPINIKRTFQKGELFENKLFKIFLDKGEEVEGGFAVIVGRKFGTAVDRNRIKRVYREILREQFKRQEKKVNLLLLPKGLSKEKKFYQLKTKVYETFMTSGQT